MGENTFDGKKSRIISPMDIEENEPSEERENMKTFTIISKELKGKCKKMVDRMECCGVLGPKIQNVPR